MCYDKAIFPTHTCMYIYQWEKSNTFISALFSKMFARFRKVNYWEDIGGIEGFHEAIETLGSNWRLLDNNERGYTDVNSIWGQLADSSRLKNKHTYEARKWLYNAWTQNRQNVRTEFYAKMGFDQSPTHDIQTQENAKNQYEIANSKVYK